jgi:hypothetical protein
LSGLLTLGALVGAAPVDAGYRRGWGGYHDDVVYRRVVVVERPVIYRPRSVVVERPYYPRYRYGWRERMVYWPRLRYGRWHDRPRCWLPERDLCD